MKRWLRRRRNAMWWWLDSRRWRWRIYREAFRRVWQGLTVDPGVQFRIMLTVLVVAACLLAVEQTSGTLKKVVGVASGAIILVGLPLFLSLRGWSRYPAIMTDVITEEYARIEGENKEWYFSELFGNGRPPQSIIDKYGEPPARKSEKESEHDDA